MYLNFHGQPVDQVATAVTTLDALIGEFGIPAFCKIDVEGLEDKVISGLSVPIPMLSFEYHDRELSRAEACLSHLSSLGSIEINVNPMNAADLCYQTWMSPEEFFARSDRPEKADCWVRFSDLT